MPQFYPAAWNLPTQTLFQNQQNSSCNCTFFLYHWHHNFKIKLLDNNKFIIHTLTKRIYWEMLTFSTRKWTLSPDILVIFTESTLGIFRTSWVVIFAVCWERKSLCFNIFLLFTVLMKHYEFRMPLKRSKIISLA